MMWLIRPNRSPRLPRNTHALYMWVAGEWELWSYGTVADLQDVSRGWV